MRKPLIPPTRWVVFATLPAVLWSDQTLSARVSTRAIIAAHSQGERSMPAPQRQRVLVTGATGYVGGRLVPLLLERGYRVRVLARDRDRLEGRSWLDRVELVLGDVLDPATLPTALDG